VPECCVGRWKGSSFHCCVTERDRQKDTPEYDRLIKIRPSRFTSALKLKGRIRSQPHLPSLCHRIRVCCAPSLLGVKKAAAEGERGGGKGEVSTVPREAGEKKTSLFCAGKEGGVFPKRRQHSHEPRASAKATRPHWAASERAHLRLKKGARGRGRIGAGKIEMWKKRRRRRRDQN